MNKKIIYLFIMLSMLITGCASVPKADIKVEAEADPKVNFSGYKTYAWLGSAAIVNDLMGQWEPPPFDADAEIKYLLNREFRNRGMSESTIAPDLIVAFVAGVDMDAFEFKKNPETEINILKNVPQGALAVILVDSNSGFVVWIGVATADIQHDVDATTVKARLNYAVTQMMKKLPR